MGNPFFDSYQDEVNNLFMEKTSRNSAIARKLSRVGKVIKKPSHPTAPKPTTDAVSELKRGEPVTAGPPVAQAPTGGAPPTPAPPPVTQPAPPTPAPNVSTVQAPVPTATPSTPVTTQANVAPPTKGGFSAGKLFLGSIPLAGGLAIGGMGIGAGNAVQAFGQQPAQFAPNYPMQ